MKIVKYGSQRKAISPVLATVILIAITLIAAIAIAGFVFGLFGSFTSSAHTSVSVTSCTAGGGNEACLLSFLNSGTANTAATTVCSVTWGGAAHAGTMSGAAIVAGAIIANSVPVSGTCTVTGATAAAGQQVVGAVQLTNGGSVQFAGQAS